MGKKVAIKDSLNPKSPNVKFEIAVTSNLYKELKDLPLNVVDDIELYKEIAIMREVNKAEGCCIHERIDNKLKEWRSMYDVINDYKPLVPYKRYKLKYKY